MKRLKVKSSDLLLLVLLQQLKAQIKVKNNTNALQLFSQN